MNQEGRRTRGGKVGGKEFERREGREEGRSECKMVEEVEISTN